MVYCCKVCSLNFWMYLLGHLYKCIKRYTQKQSASGAVTESKQSHKHASRRIPVYRPYNNPVNHPLAACATQEDNDCTNHNDHAGNSSRNPYLHPLDRTSHRQRRSSRPILNKTSPLQSRKPPRFLGRGGFLFLIFFVSAYSVTTGLFALSSNSIA